MVSYNCRRAGRKVKQMFANRFSTDTARAMSACPYINKGQRAEYMLALELTGQTRKADNRKGGADVLNYQVKSFRATLCKGNDLSQILVEYAEAERFAFVDEETAEWYDLSKAEFMEFASVFAELTKDSAKNGGKSKYRLNRQGRQQRDWLRDRT